MPATGHRSSRLHLPATALGGCIYLAVERDTRGIVLNDEQRFNYYPASPFPMISWIFEGSLHLVDDTGAGSAARLSPTVPRVVFAGPHRRPTASWSPGPVHALAVAFTPAAMFELFGIPAGHAMDMVTPLEHIASGSLVDRLLAIQPSNEVGVFAVVEQILGEAWSGVRAGQPLGSIRNWMNAVAVQAAFSRTGTGVRQAQRRIRTWTGHSHRDLERYARLEATMALAAERSSGSRLDLAGLAATAGFADQSHMGREVRRATGMTPARLDTLIESDEAYWLYRLLQSRAPVPGGGRPSRQARSRNGG